MKSGKGGFGSKLPGQFGRLLMRNEYNSELYGPLQHLYTEGKKAGTDVWIHKNRYVCVLQTTLWRLNIVYQNEWVVGTTDCA